MKERFKTLVSLPWKKYPKASRALYQRLYRLNQGKPQNPSPQLVELSLEIKRVEERIVLMVEELDNRLNQKKEGRLSES